MTKASVRGRQPLVEVFVGVAVKEQVKRLLSEMGRSVTPERSVAQNQ
jgi:hypothetical protein